MIIQVQSFDHLDCMVATDYNTSPLVTCILHLNAFIGGHLCENGLFRIYKQQERWSDCTTVQSDQPPCCLSTEIMCLPLCGDCDLTVLLPWMILICVLTKFFVKMNVGFLVKGPNLTLSEFKLIFNDRNRSALGFYLCLIGIICFDPNLWFFFLFNLEYYNRLLSS